MTSFTDGFEAYQVGDYATALQMFKLLADNNDRLAQFYLGQMHSHGEGTGKDQPVAVAWYRRAAEQGHTLAQNHLAWAYHEGVGIEKNATEAVEWYRRAAESGYREAHTALGEIYRKGEGVQQDYAEAIKWYREAADKGEKGAQYQLGVMYAFGVGVAKDYVQAYLFFSKASDQAHEDATNGLTWLTVRMTEDDFNEADYKASEEQMEEHYAEMMKAHDAHKYDYDPEPDHYDPNYEKYREWEEHENERQYALREQYEDMGFTDDGYDFADYGATRADKL